MKKICSKNKIFGLLLICFFCFLEVHAQTDFYSYHLEKGKKHLANTPPEFVNALKEFDLARLYISSTEQVKIDTIYYWNNKTWEAIETQTTYFKNEIIRSENEKRQAQLAAIQSDKARIEAEKALNKSNGIINALYFYEGNLGLACQNNKYGFINRNGDVVINYQYQQATPFYYTGLALVQKNKHSYLLDTDGNEYLLAEDLRWYPDSTQALDLSNKEDYLLPENSTDSKNLKILLLNGNQIEELPLSITLYYQLEKLYVYNNKLKSLPSEISFLSKLATLDASINNIDELPGSIGRLKNLEELILYDNNLAELPPDFGGLHQLQFLDLSDNLLTSLPVKFETLKNLKVLALGENQFKEFPRVIGSLQNLEMLDLSDNQIETLPEWISENSKLKQVNLWNNNITYLPEEIIRLKDLKTLIIGENQLTKLPRNLDSLPELKDLLLFGNRLTTLPVEIGRMKNLKKLDLRENPELDVEQSLTMFQNTGSWIVILAGKNNFNNLIDENSLQIMFDKFETLPGLCTQIKNLQLIDLTNCPDISAADLRETFKNYAGKIYFSSAIAPIVEDPKSLLINIDLEVLFQLAEKQVLNVGEIDLSGKNLLTIPDGIFLLKNINSLNLSNNELKELPADLYKLSTLKLLNLTGNPLGTDQIIQVKSKLPGCQVYFDEILY